MVIGCNNDINNINKIQKPIFSQEIKNGIVSACMDNNQSRLFIASKKIIYLLKIGNFSYKKEFKINDINIRKILYIHPKILLIVGYNKNMFNIFSLNINNGDVKCLINNNLIEINDIITIGNSKIATAHGDGKIIIWDSLKGRKLNEFGDYDCEIYSIKYSNKNIYSGNDSGILTCWNAFNGKKIKSYKQSERSIFTVSIDNNANNIITGGPGGYIYIYDLGNLSLRKRIEIKNESVLCLNIIGQDNKILYGLTNGKLGIANYNGDNITIKLHNDHIIYVELINKDMNIISVSKDGFIKLWDYQKIAKGMN
jgi:WD40 repeat protein